jgi:hypothetical protein
MSEQATPIAKTGPSELVPLLSARARTSIARATVRPLARIAGPARLTARAIASCLSSIRRSSSR